MDVVHTPTREDRSADPGAVEAATSDRTALVVGSAPAYPHGVVDPIPKLADIATDRGALCHVDACLGGFVLSFLDGSGYDIAPHVQCTRPGDPIAETWAVMQYLGRDGYRSLSEVAVGLLNAAFR